MKSAVSSVRHRTLSGVALLILAALVSGCASTTYKANLQPGSPKPKNYPILVYTEDKTVPRPCEVIGTVSIEAGKFTIFGGKITDQMQQVMDEAYAKGADVVKYTSIQSPDFTNPNYSVHADLLRYADVWETAAISRQQFQTYLATNRDHLDPIEGIWVSKGMANHAVGIMRDSSKPGRDFIGCILESGNLSWPVGAKKMDIRRGAVAGTYLFTYYLDNFDRAELPVILGQSRSFKLSIWRGEDDSVVLVYNKR